MGGCGWVVCVCVCGWVGGRVGRNYFWAAATLGVYVKSEPKLEVQLPGDAEADLH